MMLQVMVKVSGCRTACGSSTDVFEGCVAEQVVGRAAEQGRSHALLGLDPESVTPIGPVWSHYGDASGTGSATGA